MLKAEQSFYKQKAKCTYIKECDRGSKLFHSWMRQRQAKNHIASVQKENGQLTTSYKEVGEMFVDYYKQLLGTERPCQPINPEVVQRGPLLNEEHRTRLVQEVTDTEIKAALDSIGEDKAPGPDGFSFGFFKKSWHIVGPAVIKAV